MKVEFMGMLGYKGGIEQNAFYISLFSELIGLRKKKVVLVGAGVDSYFAESLFKQNGIEIYAYADNSNKIIGKTINGKIIRDPNDLFISSDDLFFVISVHDNNIFSVRLQLMAHHIKDYGIFAVFSSHMYLDDYDMHGKILDSINYICFEDESISTGLPYVSYASGVYGGKLGNLNWLLTSTLWHHYVCTWINRMLIEKSDCQILDIGPGLRINLMAEFAGNTV